MGLTSSLALPAGWLTLRRKLGLHLALLLGGHAVGGGAGAGAVPDHQVRLQERQVGICMGRVAWGYSTRVNSPAVAEAAAAVEKQH